MIKYLKTNPLFTLILVSVIIFTAHLGTLYINIMEARNFISAREMILNGNWFLTTLNELPRYEKPPLPTWLTAFSGSIFGMGDLFGLRLPAALVGVFMVVAFYKLNFRIHKNRALSFIAALILCTSFYIIFAGRNGQWDIFTHSFMVASIYFLFNFLNGTEIYWEKVILAAIFFAFSFLSKGPVSLYALWLPFLIAYAVVFRFPGFKKKWFGFAVFLLLGLALGFSWYVYVRWADPESFLEIAKEETANWGSYNTRPFYYYWSFFTQSGIWTIPAFISLFYPYMKSRVSNLKAYRFSLIWTLASVVLLSAIPEKKARYLLPVLIPLAMNTSFYIEYLILRFKEIRDKKETYPVYFNFGLIAVIGLSFPVAGYLFFKDHLEEHWLAFGITSISLFFAGGAILLNLVKKNIENVFYLTIVFLIIVIGFGFPLSKTFNTNTAFKNVDLLAAEAKKQRIKVYSMGEIAPEMLWLMGASAPRIDATESIAIPEEKVFGLLVTTDREDELNRIFEMDYHIALKENYDVNYTASPGEKAHKERLLGHYYILKKKE